MINPMRQKAINGLKVGDTLTFSRTFTLEETQQFGDLTRDYNPVHYDTRWTAAKGFSGLICHGLLVGSMICEIGGQIGWLASGMTFKFMRPVYIGATVTCTATIEEIAPNGRAKASADFTNDKGEPVGRVILTGRLPLNPEQDLLKTIAREQSAPPDLCGKGAYAKSRQGGRMKKIGIVGGLGPESTLIYYKGIIDAFMPTYEQQGYPEVAIESVDLKTITTLMDANDWDNIAAMIADRCTRLHSGGAEIGAIASNTPHKVLAQIRSLTPLPLISIVDAVRDHAAGLGLRRLGLLGTRLTMTSDFYQRTFERCGIQLVAPSPEDQAYIQDKLFTEIEFGIVKAQTKAKLSSIVEHLHRTHQTDGVILGCTELPLIIGPGDMTQHCIDSTRIHISEIVAQCRG